MGVIGCRASSRHLDSPLAMVFEQLDVRIHHQSDQIDKFGLRLPAQLALRLATDNLASNDDSGCRESNGNERDADPRSSHESVLYESRFVKPILMLVVSR